MLQANRRGGFSDRNGIKQINTEIQINDFDKRTRIQIFNLFNKIYDVLYSANNWYNPDCRPSLPPLGDAL